MLRGSELITHTAGPLVRQSTRPSRRASERGAQRPEQPTLTLNSLGSATTEEAWI